LRPSREIAVFLMLSLVCIIFPGRLPSPAYALPSLGSGGSSPGPLPLAPPTGSALTKFVELSGGGWDVVIYDGNLEFSGDTATANLAWTTPFSASDAAKTTYVVADGQSGPGFSADSALFKSLTVVPPDAFTGADGAFWDTLNLQVTSYMVAGETSASAAVKSDFDSTGHVDCLVYVAQVFGHGPTSALAGYTAQGVGLRALTSGTVTISDIPAGTSVIGAFLYFTVIANSAPTATMTLNGVDISNRAVQSGSGPSPCWFPPNSFSFRYDVTNLIPGNGVYTLTSFPTSPGSLACLGTGPCAEGASLVIVFGPTPPPIPEYPLGLPLLAIFMIFAYGLIKRRTRNPKNI